MPSVTLRAWKIEDAEFVCKVRNTPSLQRWFRQDHDLTLKEQRAFMQSVRGRFYRGQIIEVDGHPAGVCNVDFRTSEFGIAVLPEYQGKHVATKAMRLLLKTRATVIWSEVFVDNPALSWYLHKLGFKAVSVKERAYFKKSVGLIDVVRIERRLV